MIRTLTIAAGLAAAGVANATFVGGVMRVDATASADASALIGSAHTVVDMFIAFDEADDILISMENVSFTGVANLYQDAFGADHANGINPAFFAPFPQLPYDSYVGIGGPHYQGSGFGGDVDPDFVWGATGVEAGGWFATPNGNGDFAGTSSPNGGLFEVFAGRFTLEGDWTARGGSDVGDGFINTDLFEGFLSDGRGATVNWVEQQGGDINVNRVDVGVPAPGAAALFGLAGLTASRRRRG